MNFPPFCKHKKCHPHNEKVLNFFTYLNFLNDIILQCVIELVAKIYNILTNLYLHITRTLPNCFMDDLEEDYKIGKMKRLKK
jgi:hypothetical protein